MNRNLDRATNFLPRVDDAEQTHNVVDQRMVSLTAPASTAAEQYRLLHYRLEKLRELRPPMKIIAFTSAVPGEGKTVTAVNLALASARSNPTRRVVLIDADLRRSQVAHYLGVKPRPGLAELLEGKSEMADAVRTFRSTRLTVIPAGATPEEPTQLLAGERMKSFLAAAQSHFDDVYLDLPPALPFADASVVAGMADAVVLIIRANATSHRRVNEAVDQLSNARLIGCVLNAASAAVDPYISRPFG